MFSFIGRFPQPAKTLYVLIFLAFVLLFVTFVMDLAEARRFALVGVGTLFFLLGLCASLNIRGTADGMASAIKEYRPMGADYSRAFLSTPLYARLFGIMVMIIGSVFLPSWRSSIPAVSEHSGLVEGFDRPLNSAPRPDS